MSAEWSEDVDQGQFWSKFHGREYVAVGVDANDLSDLKDGVNSTETREVCLPAIVFERSGNLTGEGS